MKRFERNKAMKKLTVILVSLCLLLCLAACSSSDPVTVGGSSAPNDNIIVLEAPPKETTAPTVPLSDSGNLGEYEVTIGDYEFVQDYKGNPAILIHYTFTNNSEDNRNAMFSISCKAFQNGIGLHEATISDESIHDSSNSMKKIQPGTTIELTEAYILSSDTAPVEFYIEESVSFDNAKLGKTFEVSSGGTTILSTAPNADSAIELGNYSISINSYSITTDYKGVPTLVLYLGYTNNSSGDTPFYTAVEVTAFQDGIELESAFSVDEDIPEIHAAYLNVLPGVGHGVAVAFLLSSETSLVDIEIEPMFSFDEDKITTQIDPTK